MTPYVPVFCLVVDITHTHNCLSYTNCYGIATFFAFSANFRGARWANCARFWRGKWGRRDFDRIRKWRYVNLRGGESGRDHANVRGRCGIFFVTYIIFRLTDMQMHNKMEIEGEAPRKVLEGNYFAREYRFRSGVSSSDGSSSGPIACTDIESATPIFNSSTAVVHLIDKPLLYT